MNIATLTLNPALDKSTTTERLQPSKKLRSEYPSYDPGGGGLNVSRAIRIMGGRSLAIYAAGGPTGDKIGELLDKEGIKQQVIGTQNPTRENLMVMERSTGNHYRFGMPGYELSQQEQQYCLDAVEALPDSIRYLVASGSLPPGVDDDFYGKVAKIAQKKGIKCAVDTSGAALKKAADMGLCLMKPNLGELSSLAGQEEISGMEQEKIATRMLNEGKADILVVSLGARGAMVATREGIDYVVPPTVKQKSTVGAGDSMLGGIILSLSRGDELMDAINWGVAAGTAATMTPGTELCRRQDVEDIYSWLKGKSHQRMPHGR